jgi:hypothetical protein
MLHCGSDTPRVLVRQKPSAESSAHAQSGAWTKVDEIAVGQRHDAFREDRRGAKGGER